jgi:protein-tyrosine phosphatase
MRYGVIFLLIGFLWIGCAFLFQSLAASILAGYTAFGFCAIGIGYLLKSPAIWMKSADGTMNPISFALYLPIHLMNWLALRLATSTAKCTARHEIAPNLWLGRRPFESEAKAITASDAWAIVDLTAEFPESRELRQGKYLCLPTLDHTSPTHTQIESALSFIAAEMPTRKVLVHCALGHGRSATIIAAWMLQRGLAKTPKDADTKLREIRPGVRLKDSQVKVLSEIFPPK